MIHQQAIQQVADIANNYSNISLIVIIIVAVIASAIVTHNVNVDEDNEAAWFSGMAFIAIMIVLVAPLGFFSVFFLEVAGALSLAFFLGFFTNTVVLN